MARRYRQKKFTIPKTTVNKLRYPEDSVWRLISNKCKQLAPFCCIPGCNDLSKVTHHIIYTDYENVPLTYITLDDVEWLLGEILFTLCLYHHNNKSPDQVHHPANWNWGTPAIDRIDAFQYPHMIALLKKGYQEKYGT